ncbi:MAG: hypothetical protein R3D70_12180 [Rhizobiaceae bacterium]
MMIDQSKLDQVEGLIVAASAEVVSAKDSGRSPEAIDDWLSFCGHVLFVNVATLTRSVDAAETAVQRFADRMAAVKFCGKCSRHRVGGEGHCLDCVLDRDMAELGLSI